MHAWKVLYVLLGPDKCTCSIPQNNLRVFRNGDLVYGSGSDKGGKKKDKGEKGGNNGEGEEEAEEGAHEHGHAPGGTRGKHDAHGRGKGEKGGHGTGEEEGGSGAAGLHKFAAAARGLVRVLPAGDGGSGGAAEQEGGQQQGDGETGHRVGGEERGGGGGGRGRGREEEEPEAVVEAVVRLAAAALQREGEPKGSLRGVARLKVHGRLSPCGQYGTHRQVVRISQSYGQPHPIGLCPRAIHSQRVARWPALIIGLLIRPAAPAQLACPVALRPAGALCW